MMVFCGTCGDQIFGRKCLNCKEQMENPKPEPDTEPEKCWKCHGDRVVEEPVCGWCEDDVPHASCDDTWMRKVKCDACMPDSSSG